MNYKRNLAYQMRAILIEEDRFLDAMQSFALEKENLKQRAHLAKHLDINPSVWNAAVEEVHRSMHYHFVKWAQSHGASCVRG